MGTWTPTHLMIAGRSGRKPLVKKDTLPKTNRSPLKIGGWKIHVLFGRPMFRGYASFREGAQLD